MINKQIMYFYKLCYYNTQPKSLVQQLFSKKYIFYEKLTKLKNISKFDIFVM